MLIRLLGALSIMIFCTAHAWQNKDTLIIGMEENNYTEIEDSKGYVGNKSKFTLAIVDELCSRLGKHCEIKKFSCQKMQEGLLEGSIDIAMPENADTKHFSQQYVHGTPYYKSRGIYIVRQEQDVALINLNEARIGVKEHTGYQEFIYEQLPKAKVMSYNRYEDLIEALSNDELDVIFVDANVGKRVLRGSRGFDYRILLGDDLNNTSFTNAFYFNEKDRDLSHLVDDTINKMLVDGTYGILSLKHLGYLSNL